MSELNVIFRPMLPKDAAAVEKLDLEILKTSVGKEVLINELNHNPLAHYFVLEEQTGPDLIGHIGLWIDDKNAQILNFYVKPDFQGKGFGETIIQNTIAYLRFQGCENVTLEVRPSNAKALALYGKHGFERVATRANYYDNGEDAILMLMKL